MANTQRRQHREDMSSQRHDSRARDEVYYPTTDRADFGPCPEAVAEGRAAIPVIGFSASLTVDFGPGPEASAEGCTAGRGIGFSASVTADFGPCPEAAAEGRSAG